MKLTFYGAAREITGSCSCIEANGKKILIDCGMQQGNDQKENQQLPFDGSDIDFVILTHAHIDHSGRLPLLVKQGFTGTIYTIKATYNLLTIMLKDSAKIQEADASWENKKSGKTAKGAIQPLYTMADALNTLGLVQPCSYGRVYEIHKGIKFNFVDAGHLLGSASVELFLIEGGTSKKIVFSGDIGNINQPIIKDPQYIESGDYAVMEATYGNRNHDNNIDYKKEFAKILEVTLAGGGNVIIPSFAVGRTQGLLYMIREIKEEKLLKKSSFPVYVDSPLATEATRLYDDDLHIYGDTETRAIVKKGLNPISFPGLFFTDSVQDSIALNHDPVPKVIISSSGMCEAGRIRHHLKHNIERRESCVIIAGYQARGTLGRALLDGEKKVSIFDQEIEVAAKIYNFSGLSAHADRDGLIKWITSFDKKPDKVFVVHIEETVIDGFLKTLDGLGFSALAPEYKSAYDLYNGQQI
ncbi:MAG: MBL fold metallo-hydrolase [Actinobacteria bacterium]|nr:MBL fold metallo-hydrolase [Actinomycetota bacterium]